MSRSLLAMSFILAMLGAGPAVAQDGASVMARSEQIHKFLELLDHPDDVVRIAAMEEGLKSPDPLFRQKALEKGLGSANPDVVNIALAEHFSGRPMILVESPTGVRLDSKQQAWSEEQLPAKLYVSTKRADWDPKKFDISWGQSYDCRIGNGVLLCVRSGSSFTLRPGAVGVLTGEYVSRDFSMPLLYRYN